MSEQWEDLDQFCANRLEETADLVREAAADLVEVD